MFPWSDEFSISILGTDKMRTRPLQFCYHDVPDRPLVTQPKLDFPEFPQVHIFGEEALAKVDVKRLQAFSPHDDVAWLAI